MTKNSKWRDKNHIRTRHYKKHKSRFESESDNTWEMKKTKLIKLKFEAEWNSRSSTAEERYSELSDRTEEISHNRAQEDKWKIWQICSNKRDWIRRSNKHLT